MANHNLPTVTSGYLNFVSELNGRLVDCAAAFDPAFVTVTNPPVNTVRFSSAANAWQRWNGTAWVALATTYAISISGNAATATNVAYSGLTGTVPTWNQNTTGNAATATTATNATTAANGVSPGAVIAFARNTAPTGFLKANGALVDRTTFAALFAAIGTTFGGGDGVTTFGLPDMRGEFIRGWDDGRGADSGRGFGSAQAGANASHAHGASSGLVSNDHSHSGSTNAPSLVGRIDTRQSGFASASGIASGVSLTTCFDGGSGYSGFNSASINATHSHSFSTGGISANHNHAITVNADGSEARPRNIALLYCIKF
jgi:microcystin-dependent protein